MKVALLQSQIKDLDIENNLQKHISLLRGLNSDTELAVMCEEFLTGFTSNVQLAQSMDCYAIKALCQVAKEKNMAISTSLFIKENEKYFNRHFFFFPNGEYEYYDKRHLFCLSGEPKVVSPGKKRKIIEYRGFKIALFTCYDLRFPLWCANSYSEERGYEYDVAIFVACWAQERAYAFKQLLIARAIENVSYVIGLNRVGEDCDKTKYNGNSSIIDFKGQIVALCKTEKEETLYHSIDKESLLSFRSSFPVGKDW